MTTHRTDVHCTLQSNLCSITIHITDVVDRTLKAMLDDLDQKIAHLDDADHIRQKKLLAFPNQEKLCNEYHQLELQLADFMSQRYELLHKHLRTFKAEYEEFVQNSYNDFS